jgi:hypothetical protein
LFAAAAGEVELVVVMIMDWSSSGSCLIDKPNPVILSPSCLVT